MKASNQFVIDDFYLIDSTIETRGVVVNLPPQSFKDSDYFLINSTWENVMENIKVL